VHGQQRLIALLIDPDDDRRPRGLGAARLEQQIAGGDLRGRQQPNVLRQCEQDGEGQRQSGARDQP
jgi:hypothetical protein